MGLVSGKLPAAVGRRVRELRQRAGLSQEALAEKADLHRNYVGSVERGERDIGISAVAGLAHALGVSLAEFFDPFRHGPKRT
jgi:transcriptional regulator with XRE-family HTH domain